MKKSQQSPSQIVEEIKSQFYVVSKAGKASEQMYVNLQKKDYLSEVRYLKPETPKLYQDVKKQLNFKVKKIQDLKQSLKDNKILQSVFRSISRDRRQELTDPKKLIPTLNEFGNLPKFWNKNNCKLHISQLERGSLEEKKRLKEVYDLDMTKLMRENSHLYPNSNNQPLTQRYNSNSKDNLMNGSSSSRMDMHYNNNNQDQDDTLRDDLNLFNKTQVDLQQHTSNSTVDSPNHKSKYPRHLDKSISLPQLNNTQLTRNQSVTGLGNTTLERSQIEPYLMNIKFSRQTKRKGIDAKDVNEKRFENFNRLPDSLSTNKKVIWNLKFDRMKERDTKDWTENGSSSNGQIYNLVDPEKYKFKKTYIAKIKEDDSQATNANHHRIKSRYY